MLGYVQSLGCAPNQADAASIRAVLAAAGFGDAHRIEDAAIVVVLTCGFTAEMERVNRERLGAVTAAIQDGARLFVGGCLPGIAAGDLGVPPHAYLFGPTTIAEALLELRATAISLAAPQREAATTDGSDDGVALVRVATGCMSQCTFCAIPRAAGRTISRPLTDIVADVREHASHGVRRVLLTAEDASAYGRDVGLTFIDLLRAVLATPVDVQIGIDTLNPKWLRDTTNDLTTLLADPRLARTLYIPAQSGSDPILRAMARGYTVADVRRIFDRLFALTPRPRILTDFIVGFPTETDADFAATRALAQAYPFHFVEVFAYTERTGTPAARLDPVPPEQRQERATTLIADVLARNTARGSAIRPLVNTNISVQKEQCYATE